MRAIDGDALVKYCNGNPFITDSVKTYIRISVATMPTIEERKTGKWINYEDSKYYANCSECGYQMDVHVERGYFNFCSHCGAKMEGEGDG